MITASFSIHNLEFYLLILARVSALMVSAPFFSMNGVPRQIRIGFSIFMSIIVALNMDYYDIEYDTIIGYAILVAKEVFAGLFIGLAANLAMLSLAFAGHIIDIDLGFSMMQLFDPLTNQDSSAFGSFYTYLVMLVMLLSNMHYYLITATIDSFALIPLGMEALHGDDLYDSVVMFATEYFSIGFRIILPVFAAMLLLNIILGILAKSAPQMNMFVVGMQLKVMFGLGVLLVTIVCIPLVTDFVYGGMQDMINQVIKVITP